jgi:hypothetical protein
MNPTSRRLAVLAVVGTIGSVAPVTSASAAATSAALPFAGLRAPQFPGTGLGFPVTGFPAAAPFLTFPGAGLGTATVIGPTIITTAPSSFINTNNQVTAGSAVIGGQVAIP